MEKHYTAAQSDVSCQKKWKDEKTYALDTSSHKPLFSVDTPPPTVSGSLHIGHIFSYTQTDIIARYKRMTGHTVFYPFGFDDNGLATERFVEKKHSVTGHSMKRKDFIELCLKQSYESAQEFQALWQRLGISADWTNTYSTISATTQKISQQSFIDLYNKGLIYKKEEPALYCATCFTSVAQAELDDMSMPSSFNDITFEVEDGKKVTISTTRPELLSSCVALFFHPDDARYQHLNGKKATVPVFGYTVTILPDDLVDQNKGTGLVMCCTFGDKTDIMWFKKHNLGYRQSIGLDGKWLDSTGPLAGLRVQAAREKIVELLKEASALTNQRPLTHDVNIHERCKKPIEYVVLNQWFLKILDYKKEFLEAAQKVAWYPQFMYARYRDWVENLQWDWCLSRQRFYGIPFPVWHCLSCKAIVFADASQLPIDPQETPYNKPCPSCGKTDFKGDTDVMDTWNTSSLTPYICSQLYSPVDNPFAQPLPILPMSMRPQAHDIIRTWAFSTIVKTFFHHGTLPWKEIVISGHVLSNDRNKISKSQGNNPLDPENLLKQYPADAIRYWTATGALGYDSAFSDNQLKIGLKLQTKLWNAFRFISEHVQGISPELVAPKTTLNKWIAHQFSATCDKYHKAFAVNEFGQALAAVEHFFWHDFCDNYIELIKDQLFNPQAYTPETITETKQILSYLGLGILQLYAPYISHCTETIYGLLYQKECTTPSLHLTQFADVQKEALFPQAVKEVEALLEVISQIRKLKSEQSLSLKVAVESLIINGSAQLLELVQKQEQIIRGIAVTQNVSYAQTTSALSSLTQTNEQWHMIITLPEQNA